MMRTEATQELYEAVTGANPSKFRGGKLPVEQVTHTEAVDFAKRLTEKLREAHALPSSWELRLPTEAQWEYAARAGTKAPFPFGDRLDSTQANFNGNFPYGGAAKGAYLGKTREVGSYKPNAWGLFDTVGNAWEWTADAYEAKLVGGADPFVAGAPASGRVIRGGSWGNYSWICRSASRNEYAPTNRHYNLGIRPAAVQSPP